MILPFENSNVAVRYDNLSQLSIPFRKITHQMLCFESQQYLGMMGAGCWLEYISISFQVFML